MKFEKKRFGAKAPTYATDGSAGADLYALTADVNSVVEDGLGEHIVIAPGKTALIQTGIAVAIPYGYVGLVFARSGLATKRNLAPANKVGVIDRDYRGEIVVALHNHGNKTETIDVGERVAQLVVVPYVKCEFEEVEELETTERGEGGFGSTGK